MKAEDGMPQARDIRRSDGSKPGSWGAAKGDECCVGHGNRAALSDAGPSDAASFGRLLKTRRSPEPSKDTREEAPRVRVTLSRGRPRNRSKETSTARCRDSKQRRQFAKHVNTDGRP